MGANDCKIARYVFLTNGHKNSNRPGMSIRHDDSRVGATSLAPFAEKRSPQVLVVDDANAIRNCISFLLRANGYRVLEAENGLAAQVLLMVERPVLVISDLEMPICDGWSLLAYCHTKHPDLPVLVVSGGSLGKRPDIECWASGFLPKPFSVSELHNEVRRLISQAAKGQMVCSYA
jgi:DNA-binding NtrC family response regulator